MGSPNDYSAGNTYEEPHGRPRKDAREVFLRHVSEHARKREREGSLPTHFSVDAYLQTLADLFETLEGTN